MPSHCQVYLILCEAMLFSGPDHQFVDESNWNYCHPWNSSRIICYILNVLKMGKVDMGGWDKINACFQWDLN